MIGCATCTSTPFSAHLGPSGHKTKHKTLLYLGLQEQVQPLCFYFRAIAWGTYPSVLLCIGPGVLWCMSESEIPLMTSHTQLILNSVRIPTLFTPVDSDTNMAKPSSRRCPLAYHGHNGGLGVSVHHPHPKEGPPVQSAPRH